MLRGLRQAGIGAVLALLCVIFCGCARGPRQGPSTVTLAAVGDIFFARGVAVQVGKHGPDYPFTKTRGIIRSADLAVFNLECPLSRRGVAQRRRYLFRCDPSFARVLRRNGFDAACLANNHTLDYGRDALTDTIRAVESAGLTGFGAGRDRRDALRVRTIRVRGLNVGFVGYTDLPTLGVVRLPDKPTVAGAEESTLGREIRTAKRRCDVLVASFHWGIEYVKRPTERQMRLARLAIDSGADLVLGHHPHVLQTVESYKGRPIVYSLGAFVWDSRLFGADRSAIYLFRLGKHSAKLAKTIPVRIVKCRPAAQPAR